MLQQVVSVEIMPVFGICAVQTADDDTILAQAEIIQQRRKEQAAARRPQGTPLQNPTTYSNSVLELPFFDHTLTAYAPPKPGVYSRRAMLDDSIKVC